MVAIKAAMQNNSNGRIWPENCLLPRNPGRNQDSIRTIRNRIAGLATESEPSIRATSGMLLIGSTATNANQLYRLIFRRISSIAGGFSKLKTDTQDQDRAQQRDYHAAEHLDIGLISHRLDRQITLIG